MTDKFAFVFPGQGSQSVGMLMELADHYPIIRDTFTEASSVLGYHLFDLAKSGPPHLLNQTEKTQPVLLAASVAIWRIWKKHYGATPALLAGHSLGEYSALTAAGAVDFESDRFGDDIGEIIGHIKGLTERELELLEIAVRLTLERLGKETPKQEIQTLLRKFRRVYERLMGESEETPDIKIIDIDEKKRW